MKDQIKRVLEMNKSGVIDDDQASALIDELMKQNSDQTSNTKTSDEFSEGPRGFHHRSRHHDPRGHRHHSHSDIGDFVHQKINQAFNHQWNQSSQDDGNQITMSRFEPPRGPSSQFEKNSISVSSFSHVLLDQSKMNENKINASKVQDIRLNESEFSQTMVAGSSIRGLQSMASRISKTQIHGSKLHEIGLMKDSLIESTQFNGCSAKEVQLEEMSTIENSNFNGCEVSEISLRNSSFHIFEARGAQLTELKFENTTLKACVVTMFRIQDCHFTNSNFKEVFFAGSDSWKFRRKDFNDCRFDNCQITNVQFKGCSLDDVEIKNVTVSELKIENIHLSDLKIDGNEAFLKAFQIKRME